MITVSCDASIKACLLPSPGFQRSVFTLAGDSQYQCQLEGIPGVQLITYDETEKCDFQYIVLEIDERITGISRDQLIELLHAENVLARRYFYPGCHRMEPYRSYFPHAGLLLPETEKVAIRVLSLPTGTAIGPDEVSKIRQIIRMVVAHGRSAKDDRGELWVNAF